MIRYLYLFLIVISIFISACTSDTLPEVMQLELCATTMVSYDIQAKTIIDRTCSYSGCHDPAGNAPGDFTTYAGMENWLNETRFQARVIEQENMPDPNDVLPENLLTPEELEFLTCWAQQGYQEN